MIILLYGNIVSGSHIGSFLLKTGGIRDCLFEGSLSVVIAAVAVGFFTNMEYL